MQEFQTPFMKQYHSVKKQYPDCLVFYRMGDFYELFLDDAFIGARILNITLTSKSAGKEGKVPMAGIPYHAVDIYLTKLVKAGYKVAICEQLSPPNKKGLVERDVVRVVTPGTLLDENALEKKENNYIVSIGVEGETFAFSIADLSTGFFATKGDLTESSLRNELLTLQPAECILSNEDYNSELLKTLKSIQGMNIFPFTNWHQVTRKSKHFVLDHFGVISLESFGIEENELLVTSAAALLGYLKETQKGSVAHIKKISHLHDSEGLLLDRSSILNLELFSTIREHNTHGSLLSVLDNTTTAMGGRMLKVWMKMPLTNREKIEQRLDVVEIFLKNSSKRTELLNTLKEIPDVERLLSRLSVNLGNARDVVNLKNSLKKILSVKEITSSLKTPLLQKLSRQISPKLTSLINIIETTIVDEPPIATKEGRMIREHVDSELDSLRKVINKSKDWIMELEREEREKTGISSLKVRYNKVFGFYIEISKANALNAPKEYMRKQTLVNGERFITKELKEHEEIILSAEEKINEIEYKIFSRVLDSLISYTKDIQNSAESIGTIDCLTNFSLVSEKQHYTRPKLLYSGEIRIKQGRHPVVEKLVETSQFVPNDVTLDNVTQQLLVITGPNMAGKSVFIRQVALIVLLAQMGCFVPAQSAHVSIMDRIFVRSGASDVITSGLSTFMVEMVETAHILNNATKNSLIIMDEIGRGTSTYDGISIAWAVAEYLVTKIKPSPKTLFATHYHELQALEEQYPKQIKNYHLSVVQEKGEPIFLHSILPGGASHSFGVAVAKLAGIPYEVIDQANSILQTLELKHATPITQVASLKEETKTVTSHNIADYLIHKELENIDISNLTPLEALNTLAEIKNKLKLLDTSTRENYLEKD